jgi:hypothetical protein
MGYGIAKVRALSRADGRGRDEDFDLVTFVARRAAIIQIDAYFGSCPNRGRLTAVPLG